MLFTFNGKTYSASHIKTVSTLQTHDYKTMHKGIIANVYYFTVQLNDDSKLTISYTSSDDIKKEVDTYPYSHIYEGIILTDNSEEKANEARDKILQMWATSQKIYSLT